jgi:hypothetical protein
VDSMHVKRIGIEDFVSYIYIVRVDSGLPYGLAHSTGLSVLSTPRAHIVHFIVHLRLSPTTAPIFKMGQKEPLFI